MVSKRLYVGITLMMFVILGLYMMPTIIKELRNPYYINDYATDNVISKKDVWSSKEIYSRNDIDESDTYVLYVGGFNSEAASAARQWSEYTKTMLVISYDIREYISDPDKLPSMIIIDSDSYNISNYIDNISEAVENGVTVVFSNLPPVNIIENNQRLRSLLGIHYIREEETRITGVHLFNGFLLGGEAIYELEDEQDEKKRAEQEKMQDLDLDIPWYILTSGTETYMVGRKEPEVMETNEIRNELLPAIIWRYNNGKGNIYAINGNYMSGSIGVGLLYAIMSENNKYTIYPVINSQLLSVANFPGLAVENYKVMDKLYSNTQDAVYRDILWPSLESLSEIAEYKMSCFVMPQYDYNDENNPDDLRNIFYLKLFKEKNAEVCVSLEHNNSVSLADKWNKDMDFLSNSAKSYYYSAAYATDREIMELSNVPDVTERVHTVTGLDDTKPLISFLNDNVTFQNVTHDAFDFTYSSDLKLKSIETALAYSNILIDMNRAAWPKSLDDSWEKLYEKASGNVLSYWKPFHIFDRITVTENDKRIREFFSLDYSYTSDENSLTLDITNRGSHCFFIFRTHGDDIAEVTGGEYEPIEDNAWLIEAKQDTVNIKLERPEPWYYAEQL